MGKKAVLRSCIFMAVLCAVAIGQSQDTPPRIKVMKEELFRNFETLQKEKTPPYYMSYSIDETRIQMVNGSFGSIMAKNEDHAALLRISVRTGSYDLDNNHELRRTAANPAFSRTSA